MPTKTRRTTLADLTHCRYGHDLRVPDAIVMQTNGHRRCRLCRNEAARRSNARHTQCSVCGKAYARETTWQFCSAACSRARHKRDGAARAQANARRDALRSDQILRLCEERERCATHWERAEIGARIEELVGAKGGAS